MLLYISPFCTVFSPTKVKVLIYLVHFCLILSKHTQKVCCPLMAGQEGKPNNGRQVQPRRQEIKLVQKEDARQVSFSKRRKGLFKKASELATLCGVDVAIMVNSPAGRPYTFGSPDVDTIFNRFLYDNPDQPNQRSAPFNNEYHQQIAMINNLNQQFVGLSTQLDAANFRRALLKDRLKRAASAAPECNLAEKIDELQIDELRRLFDTLCKTKERLVARQNEINQAEGASSSSRADANIANYSGQQYSLIVGNNSSSVEGSLPTDSVQTNQTNIGTIEQRMLSSIPPSLNINPGAGMDLTLNPGLVPLSGGANNALMPPLSGISFGPFTSHMGTQNPHTGSNINANQLFFDRDAFGPSQSYGMSNTMSYNVNSNIFQPNNPLERTNYGLTQINSNSMEGFFGPSSSIIQEQFFGATDSLEQNLLGPGFGSGTLDQAGPSSPSMNNLILGPGESNPIDPEETESWSN
jgi:pheromone receptor transcription factor